MPTSSSQSARTPLTRTEGRALFSSAEATLLGCVTSDMLIDRIIGRGDDWFEGLVRIAEQPGNVEYLRRNNLAVQRTADVSRAVNLAMRAAQHDHGVVVWVPASDVHDAADVLNTARWSPLGPRGGVVLLVERLHASHRGATSARAPLADLAHPILEVADLASLPGMIHQARILSVAASRPAAVLVHPSILASIDTLQCEPGRVVESIDLDVQLRRRRRKRVRLSEGDDVLRVVRRLECNEVRNLPSPGELAEYGFILIGPAREAMRHVLHRLQLTGRVPLLELAVVDPIDHVAVARFLSRCSHAVIAEEHPGENAGAILRVAESMRIRAETPGLIWYSSLPAVTGSEDPRPLLPGDAIHPSVLARRVVHILHELRPGKRVAERLLKDDPDDVISDAFLHILREEHDAASTNEGDGDEDGRPRAVEERLRSILADIDRWLISRAPLDARGIEASVLTIDGAERRGAARVVQAELVRASSFIRSPRGIVQQSADDPGNVLVIVHGTPRECAMARRLATATIPTGRSNRVRVVDGGELDEGEARLQLREIVLEDGVTIMTLSLRPAVRGNQLGPFATETESAHEIDRQGFRRVDGLLQPADEACEVQLAPRRRTRVALARLHESGVSFEIDRLSTRARARARLRLRPILEIVEVVRSRPPMVASSSPSTRLPLPTIVHGNQSVWRCHWAGMRGEEPGLAARALIEAGAIEGYDVRCRFRHRDELVSPASAHAVGHASGQASGQWASVLFTRPQSDGSRLPLSNVIPFGEADVLIGQNMIESARACAAACSMRIAQPAATSAVLNTGSQMGDTGDAAENITALRNVVARHVRSDDLIWRDFAAPARAMFGTERPLDLVMLGFAYQRGLIPLSLASVEAGIASLAQRGYERCHDAFRLGRRLAVEAAGRASNPERQSPPIARMIRRAARSMRIEGARLRRSSADFERIATEALNKMPGLADTEAGRLARLHLLRALERCVRWGGVSYAREFAGYIVRLYESDRGERGRALTRLAILPLADAMLFRDSAYIARMALSGESRRIARRKLNAKPSRGDELSRRFVNRFEVIFGRHRLRVHFRTSDWTAAAISLLTRLRPDRWRGSRDDRARRARMIELIHAATHRAEIDYDIWESRLAAMYRAAAEGRLRQLPPDMIAAMARRSPADVDDAASDAEIAAQAGIPDTKDETGAFIAQG
ncbi:MAG: hypothetical protein ACR2GY_10105 [Phycisphaerales bacterium]